MKKEIKLLTTIFLGILLIGIVSASYCCEKTVSGAYCQNVESQSECNQTYRSIPASCEATSYCRTGTCINQQEGTCMSNTAQIVCKENNGSWSPSAVSSLAQCKLGCCLMGNQASFATQVTCNKLSSDYGITTSFQSGVTDETTCLESANALDEGACVYTERFATTCKRTTREICQGKKKDSTLQNVTFHSGYLCSATELGSNCGKTRNTKCDETGDVRFVDSCENLANIYDSSKVDDENYWAKIQEPSCGDEGGNKNSASCGDCDYYSGTICGEKTTETVSVGNNLCKDLDCVSYRGTYNRSSTGLSTASVYPRHGESWCATVGTADTVGSSYYRLMCYNGEVTYEECDPARNKICSQNISTNGHLVGNCKVNIWESCTTQNDSEDCENSELRDCKWINYRNYAFGINGLMENEDIAGACVPKYAPGFSRDQDTRVFGSENCQTANAVCIVTYKKGLIGDWVCTDNCYCERYEFKSNLNDICISIGDCGIKKNYIGTFGKSQKEITTRERYKP